MAISEAHRYDTEEQIGCGGMATVYRAHDRLLDRPVALKVLTGQPDPALKQRFLEEARASARLKHPNIVPVYDVGERDGLPYIVMEYVEGLNLKRLLQERGPMPAHQAVDMVKQVAAALAHAHQHGLVHCDVKPHNIIVEPNGRARLVDFGIAQARADRVGRTGTTYGTPLYAAPEQVTGEHVGPAADVYGLGLVLWEALTGRAPSRARAEEPARLDYFGVRLPQRLAVVIRRATQPEPSARYQSVGEMLQAVEGWDEPVSLDEATVAFSSPLRRRVSRKVSAAVAPVMLLPKRQLALPALLVAVLLLTMGTTWAFPRLSQRTASGPVEAANASPSPEAVSVTSSPATPRLPSQAAQPPTPSRSTAPAQSALPAMAAAPSPSPALTPSRVKPSAQIAKPSAATVGPAVRLTARTVQKPKATATPGPKPTRTAAPRPSPTGTRHGLASPPAAATPTDSAGVWDAYLYASGSSVSVTVNTDGRVTRLTLAPGSARNFSARRYLRIEARPAASLLVTIDGRRLGNLLQAASIVAGRTVTGTTAYLEVYGPSRPLSYASTSTGYAPAVSVDTGSTSDGGSNGKRKRGWGD